LASGCTHSSHTIHGRKVFDTGRVDRGTDDFFLTAGFREQIVDLFEYLPSLIFDFARGSVGYLTGEKHESIGHHGLGRALAGFDTCDHAIILDSQVGPSHALS